MVFWSTDRYTQQAAGPSKLRGIDDHEQRAFARAWRRPLKVEQRLYKCAIRRSRPEGDSQRLQYRLQSGHRLVIP